jgi:hypothetical protein
MNIVIIDENQWGAMREERREREEGDFTIKK